jgi:hypothetical protein
LIRTITRIGTENMVLVTCVWLFEVSTQGCYLKQDHLLVAFAAAVDRRLLPCE